MEQDIRYLTLLSKEFPSVQSACAEIIKLEAIRSLPKGTEHFMSDIHGEHEAFLHILNNASGAICEKIEELFESTLTSEERRGLAVLIYYPVETLHGIHERASFGLNDWYRVTLHRLIEMARYTASKYSRSKVRKALPQDFAYIMEELLNPQDQHNKHTYYDNIIRSVIDTGMADTLITELCTFIKRMAVDTLHIVGDIFDRGPHADVILDNLMGHHSVDIQWGNHDVLWMGAAAGSPVCVAIAVKNCIQYDNMDMLENAYGINLLPLAVFSDVTYRDAAVFRPRVLPAGHSLPRDSELFSRMHKAMCVIMFKLEGQIIARRPEYQMSDRDMLSRINYQNGTIEIDGTVYPLRDTDFPTIDPADPNKLTPEEQDIIDGLVSSFRRSEKLQIHTRFLYSVGSIYRRHNGNLLYHGCIPMTENREFDGLMVGGKMYRGKELMDFIDTQVKNAYFLPEDAPEKEACRDFMWYLWNGAKSPVFGKDKNRSFEHYFIEDPEVMRETMNPYYQLSEEEETCDMILKEFGLPTKGSHIINGHMPVKIKSGETPIRAGGKLFIIDGGLSKAYQERTGIAGYTLIFNSHHLALAEHKPFDPERERTPKVYIVEKMQKRITVADTDEGKELAGRIEDLKELLKAYRSGLLKERVR